MDRNTIKRSPDEPLAGSSNPDLSMDVLAREEADLDRMIFRNGFGELVSGFFIMLATLGMCGIVYNVPYLQWIRGSFYWMFFAVYMIGLLLAKRSLKRRHPEISSSKISQYADSKSAPAIFLMIPLMMAIGLAAYQLGEWGIAIPAALEKILVMLFCFGFFSGLCFLIYSKMKQWRWIVWGFLAMTIMLLLGFTIITLDNFTLFTLPFGLLMFIFGAVVSVSKPTGFRK